MKLEDMTEPQLKALMKNLARTVEDKLNRLAIEGQNGGRNQFLLLVFDDPKVAQYIATCTRETMILALREAADRLERRQDVSRVG